MGLDGDTTAEPAGRLAESDSVLSEALITVCYRYALRLAGGDRTLADDLTQQACEEAVRALSKSSIGTITAELLVVTVRRRFSDALRREYRDRRLFSKLITHTPVAEEPDWAAIGGDEALECLGRLGATQRAALIFRYVDAMSLTEVANELRRSPSATESLLARARRNLSELVTEVRHG